VMLALTIIAMSAAQMALGAEKSARNERDRHLAFEAAEAGLLDAERDIEGGADPASSRAQAFASGSAFGFVEGCGEGAANPNLGLCAYRPASSSPAAPAWQAVGLADAVAAAATPYGKFTGAALPAGAGALPVRPPRYVIELMPLVVAGEDAGQGAGKLYRITAIGFGARDNTHVVLQEVYRKVVPSRASLQ
ncbi:MAG: pilus assembly protein, partial [Massilia sp.]|nr:pilus assembly protein [Massilia sp.]